MSRKRATWGEIKIAQARAARMEAVAEAWRARYWEVKSGGQLIPSPEDRAEHERLIGPMPQ